MKRREFSLGLVAGSSIIAAGLLAGRPALAQGQFVSGKDFKPVNPAQPNDAPNGKVEVIEFFWYGCPHCFAFEPSFNAWRRTAPADAYVQFVPVAFSKALEPHSRIYYVLEGLNRLDLHDKVYNAIHVEKKRLLKDDEISAFFAANGVDAKKAMALFNSFGVQSKVQRANQLVNAYDIDGTPAIGIGGRYWTGAMAGSLERALQVTNYLVAQIKAGKAA